MLLHVITTRDEGDTQPDVPCRGQLPVAGDQREARERHQRDQAREGLIPHISIRTIVSPT